MPNGIVWFPKWSWVSLRVAIFSISRLCFNPLCFRTYQKWNKLPEFLQLVSIVKFSCSWVIDKMFFRGSNFWEWFLFIKAYFVGYRLFKWFLFADESWSEDRENVEETFTEYVGIALLDFVEESVDTDLLSTKKASAGEDSDDNGQIPSPTPTQTGCNKTSVLVQDTALDPVTNCLLYNH